jgi:hypothetical protein
MRQVEVSRTIVFGAPRYARAFFEALVAGNLDLGRPEHAEILFKRSPRGRKPKDPADGTFKTAIDRSNQGVTINAFWRHSRVPTLTQDGRRAPGLRFGDPRVMALAGTLASTLFAVTGITNKSLRALMTGLLGTAYSANQASYDLARLSRNGIVARIPHRNLYALTPDGLRFAIFRTKVHDRILRPLMAGDQPQAPPPLRDALRVIDHEVISRSPQRDSQQPPDQPRLALIPRYPAGNSRQTSKSSDTQAPLRSVRDFAR